MIQTLEIKNFKSIKHLKLDCKRLNIFIGEPNTGKSNILESLAFLSFAYYKFYRYDAKGFVRFDNLSNLFHDDILDDEVEVKWDGHQLKLIYRDGRFDVDIVRSDSTSLAHFSGSHEEFQTGGSRVDESQSIFKYYRFKINEKFDRRESDFLMPPFGDNLMSLLLSNKELRALANQPFASRGLRLGLRPSENKIEIIKDYEDIIVSHPYHLASETFQRLIFYMAAIVSNKESVLIFEEPESHAFPYYTKYLAEMIALDENKNQYFISTHNPYFLLPIIEKTPLDEVRIFITYYEDYQTKVKPLSNADMQRLTDIDVFSNLEAFLEEE